MQYDWKKGCAAGLTAAMLLGAMTPAYASAQVTSISGTVPAAAADQTAASDASGGKAAGASEAPVDTKISRERAIELAKGYVTIPGDYKLQNVNNQSSFNPAGGSRGSWSLSFVKQDQNRYYGNISVSVDADTGKLLSFYLSKNEPDKKPVFPPKVQLAQAKQLVEEYIAAMKPELKDQIKYDDEFERNYRMPLNGPVQYQFRFFRTVNGVVFPQNSISVTVGDEGGIVGFNLQWDDTLNFKKPENIVPADQAAELFKKNTVPELQYIMPYDVKEKPEPMLAYQMIPFLLDAEKGEAIAPDGSKPAASRPWLPVSDKPLGQEPQTPMKLTKEQAVERAASLLPIPKDSQLQNAAYREYTDPRIGTTTSAWELRWSHTTEQDKGKPDITAVVDSDTGSITHYSKYDIRPLQAAQTQAADWETTYKSLQDKAVQYVKAWLPAYAHELYFQEQQISDLPKEKLAQMNTINFNFRRMAGGAFTEFDQVSLSFDRSSGELQYFNSNLSRLAYPAELPAILPNADAKSKLLSQYRIELQYVIDPKSGGGFPYPAGMPMEKYNVMVAAGEFKPNANAAKPETRLVYALKPAYTVRGSLFLDAVTGEWKSRENGKVVKPQAAPPSDINGHWAENALRLMVDYQALDVKDGKVLPDAPITRGEMIKMMLLTLNGGYDVFPTAAYAGRAASFSDVAKDSPYFAYVENAVDRGLIDRTDVFRPDATLSRAELAGLIVRGLGYRKLAEVDGLFTPKATDLDGVKNPGDIALVTALQIMSADGTRFSPEVQVTRASAAAAFYKFLQVRAELQDSPNRGW
ncbi:S-layer homology domain-containing protein [Paenibacillus filicis]|uniref:S-layer homology domain-containing protein n=1 Tax=Paenibacillus gyeongsangnamensis TaxID=3388067 RepID=A0ABT4QHE7_9BACL|nr:S-layer homology domain-containing protein [Paenibacillus filicis]MCZ8516217.1 S-layer homology domain-containing protein [Paenibacillus filicis]